MSSYDQASDEGQANSPHMNTQPVFWQSSWQWVCRSGNRRCTDPAVSGLWRALHAVSRCSDLPHALPPPPPRFGVTPSSSLNAKLRPHPHLPSTLILISQRKEQPEEGAPASRPLAVLSHAHRPLATPLPPRENAHGLLSAAPEASGSPQRPLFLSHPTSSPASPAVLLVLSADYVHHLSTTCHVH